MNDLAYVKVNVNCRHTIRKSFIQIKIQSKFKKPNLANVDKWYAENGMKRNYTKYQAILMGKCEIKHLNFPVKTQSSKTVMF